MGMAASQARCLALTARKSNCEYEGQQINQARTVLSNQSANLFNQMLGLNVPIPPNTADFTRPQYSFKDGENETIIDSWNQLAQPEAEYNYVVTHHYYANVYTGSQKKMNDPQVQFSTGTESSISEITEAIKILTDAQKKYEAAQLATQDAEAKAKELSTYQDITKFNNVSDCKFENGSYKVNENSTFVNYSTLDDKTEVDATIKTLQEQGALPSDFNTNNIYYDNTSGAIAFKDDLDKLKGISSGTQTVLPVYITGDGPESVQGKLQALDIEALKQTESEALSEYNKAKASYEALSRPTYLGNSELELLTELDEAQRAEIDQIIKDMEKQGIDSSIADCFNEKGEYTGGIYSFKMGGITYYTTYEDLANSYNSGTGPNHIDGQKKLAYYNASYVSTKIETTEKALLETDSNGRFVSVRFEDNSLTYTLTVKTVTDDLAYEDAMNQYNYENNKYNKMVQDINAKTSIIQQEDRQLELRLKQLDTERSALVAEIEAVAKVVKDNVDKTFKTFGN